MYESFYGLTEKPFNLTPDPRYLYLSEKHNEAFAHLLYGIRNRSGFVMITGEIGTGKTTICRALLREIEEDVELAYIFNPRLSPEELLRKINEEFGIESTAGTVKGLIDELNDYLLKAASEDKNCVLMIDEAQNLTPSVLEQVRLLSNLETDTQKLLQIILVGQPELGQNLELPELRQLNQRITARCHLQPLTYDEMAQYIACRLRVAGGRRKVQFPRSSLTAIHRASGGTPRVINAICDRALLIGYTQETRNITPDIVRKAASEIVGERPKPPKQPKEERSRTHAALPLHSVLTAALLVVILLAILRPDWLAGRAAYAPTMDETAGDPAEASPTAEEDAPGETGRHQVAQSPPEPFSAFLQTADPRSALSSGLAAVLRRWGWEGPPPIVPPGPADEAVTSVASGHGFEAVRVPAQSIAQLQRLNLPALVKLISDRHPFVWAGLVGIHEGKIILSEGPGETTALSPEQFRRRYAGEAMVLWRAPKSAGRTLTPGSRGASVARLQRRLVDLGLLQGQPSGYYDAATAEAVRRLQEMSGLKTDGIAGPQTEMALASWSGETGLPSLRDFQPQETPRTMTALAAPRAPLPAAILPRNRRIPATGGEPAPPPAGASEPPSDAADSPAAPAEATSFTPDARTTAGDSATDVGYLAPGSLPPRAAPLDGDAAARGPREFSLAPPTEEPSAPASEKEEQPRDVDDEERRADSVPSDGEASGAQGAGQAQPPEEEPGPEEKPHAAAEDAPPDASSDAVEPAPQQSAGGSDQPAPPAAETEAEEDTAPEFTTEAEADNRDSAVKTGPEAGKDAPDAGPADEPEEEQAGTADDAAEEEE